jgi:hypothetical protein
MDDGNGRIEMLLGRLVVALTRPVGTSGLMQHVRVITLSVAKCFRGPE